MTADDKKKMTDKKRMIRNLLKVLVAIVLILIIYMVICRLSSGSETPSVAVPQYRFEFFG